MEDGGYKKWQMSQSINLLLCCTAHTSGKTCQPAGVSSLPRSTERYSGSPPVSPQSLRSPNPTRHEIIQK